jgi:DNA-binding response OmpR family regulator
MSENKIPELLLISQGSAFMINSLETNIKKATIYVTKCEPNVRDFDENIVGKDIVLLFAGEFITESSGFLSYLSSKCTEENIHLCVVGYPNEIADIERNVEISNISAEIVRPFDMKEFVEKIRAIAYRESVSTDQKAVEKTAADGRKHHILMCDDDMMFLKMMQEWLSERYRITVVRTGTMAVPFALNNDPELILLDYEMPVMNGPKVLETLRDDRKTAQIPVVFLTGHSDKDSVLEVMKMKPQGYLLKSTKKEDILASIDNFFATGKWKNVQS